MLLMQSSSNPVQFQYPYEIVPVFFLFSSVYMCYILVQTYACFLTQNFVFCFDLDCPWIPTRSAVL